jgi:hypothetical protein
VPAIEKALAQREDQVWKTKTDEYLSGISWDATWQNMVCLMQISYIENNGKA